MNLAEHTKALEERYPSIQEISSEEHWLFLRNGATLIYEKRHGRRPQNSDHKSLMEFRAIIAEFGEKWTKIFKEMTGQ